MSTNADAIIAALRTNHDDLATRVRGFDEADLARESGAAEWPVSGVLSHLGSAAEIMLAGLQAARTGQEPPDEDFAPSVWERWNAKGPQERAAGFLRAGEELVSVLEELDDKAREDIRMELGFLPKPADVTLVTGMRLTEAALHGWDVRVAFDPQAVVTSQEAGIILDLLTGMLNFSLGFLGRGEGPSATDITLQVETTDPERVLALALGDTSSLSDAPDGVTDAATGVLAAPAEAVVRLLYGRLGPERTPDSVRLESDAVTLDQLRAVFPGI